MRACILGLLALAVLTPSGQVTAATVCTASTTPMSFPGAGPTQVDSTATVTVTCNTFGLSAVATARVRMCLNLDGGSAGVSQTTPRRMTNAFGDPLGFQIYRDAARTAIWGGPATPGTPTPVELDLSYGVPVLGGSGSIIATAYGRVPAQAGAAAGTYANAFGAANATITYRYSEALIGTPPPPPNCVAGGTGGGSTGWGFTASAPVASRCTLSTATDLDFGTMPGLIASPRDQIATITFSCTGRTPWTVGLDNGIHASGALRRMRLGATANYVRYELYRNAGRSDRWGVAAGTDTASGTGTGSAQSLTVYGRVPSGQTVAPGGYADTVTVTVTY